MGAVLGGALAGRLAVRIGPGWAVIAAGWLTPLAYAVVFRRAAIPADPLS